MHHPGGSDLRSHLKDFQVRTLASAVGVPRCSENLYCNCNTEEHDLSQGFWAPSSKNREQWGSGNPAVMSLGLKESYCRAFHLPASVFQHRSSNLCPSPGISWLQSMFMVCTHWSFILHKLESCHISGSFFRKLTSDYILGCSVTSGMNFSSLKLYIISNLKNYRFAVFQHLSSVLSWQLLQSLLEGKAALPFPFVISCDWLHVLLWRS